jgi:hypothetical protein
VRDELERAAGRDVTIGAVYIIHKAQPGAIQCIRKSQCNNPPDFPRAFQLATESAALLRAGDWRRARPKAI